jgi:hypothetical protein
MTKDPRLERLCFQESLLARDEPRLQEAGLVAEKLCFSTHQGEEIKGVEANPKESASLGRSQSWI